MAEIKPGFVSLDHFVANSFMGRPAKLGYPGFFKNSRFYVAFDLPKDIVFSDESNTTTVEQYLSNNIETIEMPSVSISSSPTPFSHQINQRVEEGQINAVFFEDPIMSVRNVMWSWINSMSDKRSDHDNIMRSYLSEIAGTIRIYPLTLDGSKGTRHDQLIDVFPIAVAPKGLDIKAEQEVGKTNVTFKYRYHSIISDI